ncbi:MAG: diphthine--ammonia ligase, partial [Candidatus Micrarchaeota archaeon]|nr:diphthine--ammonia ligase [Candidatus Micrarchaeota archaeon]
MEVAALFSGGKDSTLALLKAMESGHNVRFLATVHSANPDSFMYHTSNIGLTVLQAKALGIDLVSKESKGVKENEVHDLKILLSGLDIQGVVSGAVASRYQKERIERICKDLGLKSITPLWGREPRKILEEVIERGMNVIVT